MRKRLRKKKRVGEFQELGFELAFAYDVEGEAELDQLWDSFIEQAIEGNNLECGGGGDEKGMEYFVVAAGGRASATEDHRQCVRSWLEAEPCVKNIVVGPLRDAWHGWDE